jgi:Ca2+-binding EF-hand superfamily protein
MTAKVCVWAAALALVATPAIAQGRGQARGQQGRENMRFAGLDRNGDGVITRAEWNGNDRSFQNNDWNGDGILSGEEVRPGARRAVPRQQEPTVDSAAREEDFNALDFNRDGIVTEDEWYLQREAFVRADRNRDNIVTRSEFMNQDVTGTSGTVAPQIRTNRFADLDTDRDNRVSVDEWQGTPERFEVLDDNRDGFLSRREVSGNDGAADVFNAIDANRNGVVTRDEWRATRDEFDRRDANRDGRLSRTEMTNAAAPRAQSNAYQKGFERGMIEGRQAGREDFQTDRLWDLEGQRELEQADSGYDIGMGLRADYQAGYREGFRRGYPEGFTPR